MEHESIQLLFDKTAEKFRDKTAIDRVGQKVTYGELEARANNLANFLLDAGASKGAIVAILAEDSIAIITAILGILKAGGVFVPLDPALPAKRLEAIVSEVSPAWFVIEAKFFPTLSDVVAQATVDTARVICLDKQQLSGTRQDTLVSLEEYADFWHPERPAVTSAPDDMCYIYFTSGSTGRPKGIAGRLAGLHHFIRWEIQTFGIHEGMRVSQLTTPSFDPFLRDIFVPLCAGGTVCVPAGVETILDTRQLIEWIDKQHINLVHCVPSLFRAMVNEVLEPGYFASLRYILLAGEPLLPSDVKRWMDVYGTRVQLVNLLGPTETTLAKFCYFVQPTDKDRRSIPIGKPIEGAAAIVVDAKGKPCPPGMVGEIYIRTPYRSLGYYNRPDLTRDVFIPNPFSKDPTDIVYKTGDLGRVLEDGNFEYLGRRDQQVKIRGMRIELAEIESLLRDHAAIKDVAVIDREDVSGTKYLCAYVVLGEPIDSGIFKEFLARYLPKYMVPSVFVAMDALPRTLSGKVNRRDLPTPDQARLGRELVPPRTPVETLLVDIWAEVLGLKSLSISDSFFELGGHSLLATRILSRVRDALEAEVPLRHFFAAPTVAGMAEYIESTRRRAVSHPAPPLERVPRAGALPLSFAQQRLWFLDQLEPGSAFYNIFALVRLQGQLNFPALEQTFSEIVRRHEVLRTIFPTEAGQPLQVITPATPLRLPLVDCQGLAPSAREAAVQRVAATEAQRPFDLATGPLFRALVLCLDPAEHVLLVSMHHIVADGWSSEVLVREVGALYEALCSGMPAWLPELPIQYADYAHWQRQWLQGEVLETQLAYWKEKLGGALPVLQLPTDRPRPAVQRFQGAHQAFALSPHLSDAVRRLCQQQEVTLFTLLLAAFKVVLCRYTGQEDVVVGSPIANRTRTEIEELVGFFVNTLVLRTDLSGNPTLQECVQRVREVVLEAAAHQDLPFEKLVDELQPERNLRHTPLFQVVFMLEHAPRQALELPGLRLSFPQVQGGTAKFDLTLIMAETEQGLTGRVEYNTDLFEAGTIDRLVGHFQTLLDGMVANPQQRLSEVPLLTAAERQQVLSDWNATATAYPQEECIQSLFEAQVARTPEAIAVVCAEQHLTYQELNRRANGLAHALVALGVGPEVLVGLCVERSLEMAVGLLGILKAGGAYVPLDPTYPAARLAWMMADTQMPVLLTQQRWTATLPASTARVLCLEDAGAALAAAGADNPGSRATADTLAYVMYTSGSTGQPKGVSISHRSVVRLVQATNYITLSADEVWLQGAPLAFDASTLELWGSLLHGARLVMLPPQTPSLEELGATLQQHQVTTLWLTAGLFHLLVEARLADLRSVRQLLAGGDVLSVPQVQKVGVAWPDCQVINGYGPTENTTFTCCYPVPRGTTLGGAVPIGRPIANTQVYVLDQQGQPVPVGVAGELYTGGAGLARGYWQRPDLTAERFVPHPFSRVPGARLYRTGDLVRYLADGTIDFLGRQDQQVKVRGFRIELGEIETALAQHAAVQDVVVVARGEEGPGSKRLVAYLVAAPGVVPTVRDLRAFLMARVPDYMLPAAFVWVDALPLTANGKVDRLALPAPEEGGRSARVAASTAPRTAAEAVLARIWAEVLGLAQVGVEDNFFELGGDSILSIQVVSRAHQAGLRLTPKQLFQHPTIAALAVAAEIASPSQAEQGLVTGPVPLTPIQRWFCEQQLPEPHHFNQSLMLEVRQAFEPALLQQAVQHLLEHHDALRLRLVPGETGWQQVAAAPDAVVPFTQIDVSALPEPQQRPALEAAAAALQASLHLTEGPLLRVALFDFGTLKPGRLLLVIHHLVVDGVSWRILLEDLQKGYRQLSRGEVMALPPKTTSFKRWAHKLLAYAQSATLQHELGYWLTDARTQATPLPVDYPEGRRANTIASARTVIVALSVAETQALLQEVPQAYHTQMNDVLLTALVQVLAPWIGTRAVLVDLEGHGREALFDDVDLSRTVGWFTSLFPVRLDLGQASTPGQALKGIKEQLRSVPNRGLGYGVLRYLCSDPAVAGHLRARPQAEVSFNYLGQADQVLSESQELAWASEAYGPGQSLRGHRPYVLDVNGIITEGRLKLVWQYSEQVHHRDTVERLAQGYVEALRALIAHCQAPDAGAYTPSDFPLAELDAVSLDELAGRDRDIEDIYPLAPMQEGMLFHSLYAPGSGVYITQVTCTVGNLQVSAWEYAWQQLMERHPILRTAFVWRHLEKPLQVVRQHVRLPLEQYDWRELTPHEQQASLAAYLRTDQQRGFQLSQAPLMRLALMRLAEDTYYFVWTNHHLLLDGWSVPLLLQEVLTCYEAYLQGREVQIARRRPYRDYIAWLQQQNLSRAEAFWRHELKGFHRPTPLGILDQKQGDIAGQAHSDGRQQRLLSLETTEALYALTRQQGLTLNTLVQGAWAILLSHYSAQDDVVFGVTVAGRPADLPGAEAMLGLFINTLPVRVRVEREACLLPWLQTLQNGQVELRQYEYSPLPQVHSWSEVSQDVPLFESIVVFENYPTDAFQTMQKQEHGLTLEAVTCAIQNSLPCTVRGVPGPQLQLEILYDTRRFDAATILRVLEHLHTLLHQMVTRPESQLAEFIAQLAAADRQHQRLKAQEFKASHRQRLQHIRRKAVSEAPEGL